MESKGRKNCPPAPSRSTDVVHGMGKGALGYGKTNFLPWMRGGPFVSIILKEENRHKGEKKKKEFNSNSD